MAEVREGLDEDLQRLRMLLQMYQQIRSGLYGVEREAKQAAPTVVLTVSNGKLAVQRIPELSGRVWMMPGALHRRWLNGWARCALLAPHLELFSTSCAIKARSASPEACDQ